jgi:hypothetical protein
MVAKRVAVSTPLRRAAGMVSVMSGSWIAVEERRIGPVSPGSAPRPLTS